MAQQQTKLTFKNIKTLGTQIGKDLRQLQKEGMTLPDILYNYRVQEGRMVRKKERARRGSTAGDELKEDENADADADEGGDRINILDFGAEPDRKDKAADERNRCAPRFNLCDLSLDVV